MAPHQYKWFAFDGSSWAILTGWTAANTYAWTPTAANANYRVGVWVRSAGNSADALEASIELAYGITVPVAGPVTALSLNADKAAPQGAGTVITWSATPSGGAGPHQYKWFLFNGSWTAVTGWTTASTFPWTPAAAGSDYRVGVWVRSAGNTADALEASAEKGFAISTAVVVAPVAPVAPAGPVSSVSLTSNVLPVSPGVTVTWTATAVGGAAPYQFKWFVYDDAGWSAVGTWTTSSTLNWTPPVANPNYRIGVWVRSAGNTADALEAATEAAAPIR